MRQRLPGRRCVVLLAGSTLEGGAPSRARCRCPWPALPSQPAAGHGGPRCRGRDRGQCAGRSIPLVPKAHRHWDRTRLAFTSRRTTVARLTRSSRGSRQDQVRGRCRASRGAGSGRGTLADRDATCPAARGGHRVTGAPPPMRLSTPVPHDANRRPEHLHRRLPLRGSGAGSPARRPRCHAERLRGLHQHRPLARRRGLTHRRPHLRTAGPSLRHCRGHGRNAPRARSADSPRTTMRPADDQADRRRMRRPGRPTHPRRDSDGRSAAVRCVRRLR